MKKEKPEKKFKITVSINKQPVKLLECHTAEDGILHIAKVFKYELEKKLHYFSSHPGNKLILDTCSEIDSLITDVMQIESDLEKVKTFQDKIIEIIYSKPRLNGDDIFKNVIAILVRPDIDLAWYIESID